MTRLALQPAPRPDRRDAETGPEVPSWPPDPPLAVRDGPLRVWLSGGVKPSEAAAAIQQLPDGPGRHYLVREVGGARAMVKVYNRRAGHGVIRRLRAGRSVREARGYLAFALAGIPTPRLLLWAEQRRLGLWERGVIVTAMVDAPTVAEAWRAERDGALLDGAARALARIHAAGLAHGDPRTRNFLATVPEPTPFDLCSWGALTERARTWDLVQFLGSAMALTGDDATGRALLGGYRAGTRGEALAVERLLAEAAAYARREAAP